MSPWSVVVSVEEGRGDCYGAWLLTKVRLSLWCMYGDT
jgi:hypothetical protein